MKKNLKSVLSIALVLLLIAVTGLTFAYWDKLTKDENPTIDLGQGKEIVVDVIVGSTEDKLIPTGMVLGTGEVDEVVFTYNVRLDQEVKEDLNLTVKESNVKIGVSEDEAINGLVNIDIALEASTINNTNILVTVTVTLDEPITEPQYNAVINQPITFTLTFTASRGV